MNKIVRALVSVLLIISLLGVGVYAATPTYDVSSAYRNGAYYQKLLDVKLTGNQAKDIVNVALSQVGYHEGSSGSDLSGNSSSSANYTEYGRWFGQQSNWCAIFISWCANQAGISTSVVKKNAVASGNSCQFGEKKYSFGSRNPQPGDILYVQNDSDSSVDHVGLVYKVDDTYIYAVEGNFGNKVGTIKYYKDTGRQTYYSSTKILFYGVPDYLTDNAVSNTAPTTPAVEKGDVNIDKKVNSNDALLILEYSVGKRVLSDTQKKAADMDSDGVVDSVDALAVLKKSTGR
ncbi:MAG: CHAP domain-containing protein [Clostridia bacterium]|nr:CHAP domain-containing protein [Clostridia bacterium]